MDELVVESDLYAEGRGKYPWHYLPAAVNAVFTLLSPFFGGIFYVTEENACHRGDFFEVCSFLKEMEGLLDRLTGLLNQNAFQLMTTPEGHGELHAHTSAVVLDIDHFKQISDTRGHLQGGEYIRQVARVLKLAFGNHKLFRVGGDEFAVLLPNGTETEACRRLERTEQLIEKQRRDASFPTISYGYAFAASPHAIESSVKRADELMYEQKKRKEAEILITQ